MKIIQYFSERKLLAFVFSVLFIQLVVLTVGLTLRLTDEDITEQQLQLTLTMSEEELNEDQQAQFAANISEVDTIESSDNNSGVVQHKIAPGDTLSRIWSRYSSDATAAIKAFDALKEVGLGVSALRVGLVVELTLEQNNITRLELELHDARRIILERGKDFEYVANLIQPEIIEQERTVSGVIKTSFAAAASENNIPYQVIDQLVDLFGASIEFRRSVQVGDSFSIMYTERKLADGRLLEPGPIKGGSFHNAGRWMAAVGHADKNGETIFYDEQGRPLGEFFLRYPLQFSRISSVFSDARLHPVYKRVRPHYGVDFAAPTGTPVRSVGAGIIEVSGYRGGAGNMVKIKHNDKYSTAYMHLHTIAKDAKRGARVSRGQVIGTVGMTGTATGPHLHYSLYVNGKYVDPMKTDLPQIATKDQSIPQEYFDDVILALKTAEENMQVALLQNKDDTTEIG